MILPALSKKSRPNGSEVVFCKNLFRAPALTLLAGVSASHIPPVMPAALTGQRNLNSRRGSGFERKLLEPNLLRSPASA